ncbi:MAG: thiamine-phosphate kinase [Phenylobacterium sp.]|uniref:thiamine-phosphate kinase n=1 Tax=Phenylobacterium sp. TaxID=1871053 RepID=UPI0027352015|nr:thiamine-phosphate kinase [Phenylobacterium sp.]MDP1641942.1 thiamine-phosphate kinase [Phenylobacterium sp.]MDP3117270.1 thiamine-phosphate kinase [Phenylobacterium sp.]MDP3381831.1 thiamine-phosphate kinase [Phenylobacterium sp.]
MSGPDETGHPPGEFEQIARLYRPLTRGAPEALGLLDDAAVIPSRPGYDLVVTKDALVEGVHFPWGEARDLVARKLLRTNLSDLAAKGAKPFGYFLAVAWPPETDFATREAFAHGLQVDGAAFDVSLLGGDTVSTSGPLSVSMTLLGWVPEGRAVLRSGARPGDLVMVSGPIGDGGLGLAAVEGRLADVGGYLAGRYRLPTPRLDLRESLGRWASACADVSDGLIADAGHIATASGVALRLDLARAPVSPAAAGWLAGQPDQGLARGRLASFGDDYELVVTAPPAAAAALGLSVIGEVEAGAGVDVTFGGAPVTVAAAGWTHR